MNLSKTLYLTYFFEDICGVHDNLCTAGMLNVKPTEPSGSSCKRANCEWMNQVWNEIFKLIMHPFAKAAKKEEQCSRASSHVPWIR